MARTVAMRTASGGLRELRPRLLTSAFVMVAVAELAYFTADGVLLPSLPRYVEGPLGAGNVAVGLVVGAFSISAFFLRPWAGRMADRRGRRLLMVVGGLIWAMSVAGYIVTDSVPVLVGMRLVTGVGEALFFVGALAANVDLAPPERRGEAFSFASLALYIGIGAGPFIGEAVIDRFGFTATWLVAIGLALTATGLAARLPAMVPELEPEPSDEPRRQRLVHPKGLLPGIVLLAAIWGMAGFLTFVPLYALDLGMSGSGLVLGLFAGVVVLIRSVGARIPDVIGAGRATRIALVLTATGLAVIGLWREPAGLVLGAAVLGLGVALFTPALFTIAMDGVPANERGAVMGTTSAFLDVALGAGPASLGVVAAAFGRDGTFLAGSGMAALGLLLVVVTRLGVRETSPTA
ncbi:MAG: MFS transporter [Actinomycetota bacterium]|nr:MAG: MFS transporter [Actinomycetota bacterium]